MKVKVDGNWSKVIDEKSGVITVKLPDGTTRDISIEQIEDHKRTFWEVLLGIFSSLAAQLIKQLLNK
jgi:hypothetical protein